MFGKNLGSIAVSAALAVSLCPGVALASPLVAGQAEKVDAPKLLQTQASKQKQYLLTSVKRSYTTPAQDADSGEDETTTEVVDYSYNYGRLKQALEKKTTETATGGIVDTWDRTTTLTYSGAKLKSAHYAKEALTRDLAYKHNKKGKLASCVESDSDGGIATYTYTWNKKNRLTKSTARYAYLGEDGAIVQETETKKYSKFKGSHPRTVTEKNTSTAEPDDSYTYSYTYDKKGNIKRWSYRGSDNADFMVKITYGKGKQKKLAVKRVEDGITYTYTFKKKPVKKSYKSAVAAQQWALVNGQRTNAAFGPLVL